MVRIGGRKPGKQKSSDTPVKLPRGGAEFARKLAQRFGDSLLPGERKAIGEAQLGEAAKFAIAVLARRESGEALLEIESIGGGAGERHLRIAVINDDMPFLVDSIAATLAAYGLAIGILLHPVIAVRRDKAGKLVAMPDPDPETGRAIDGESRESVIYLETDRADAKLRQTVMAALRTTLGDVRAAVTDWPKLQQAMAEDAETLADHEGAALLRWLNDGMLTQLGHVIRKRDGSHSRAIGICRKSARSVLADASYDRAFAWFDGAGDKPGTAPLMVKANRIANVHRRVPLDLFLIPVREQGAVIALSVHAGVWTSAALAAPPERIPRMRAQLADLMDRLEFDPRGHAGKGLVHALTALPHDLLIGFSDPDLERIATAMMSLTDRPRPQLALVQAPLARHLFAFVWLPRDALSTALRQRVSAMLTDGSRGEVLDWSLSVEGSELALLRFVLDIRGPDAMVPDEAALNEELRLMVRGWADAVEAELASDEDPRRAAAIAARFAEAFPVAYRSDYGAAEAALDIRALRAVQAAPDHILRAARLHCPPAGEDSCLRLKLYQRVGALALSDAVPVLENFGFRVLEEIPTALDDGRLGFIHDFILEMPGNCDTEALMARAPEIEAAIAGVLNGAAEDDAFNRLIVATALDAAEAEWLRAWFRYLRQAGVGFAISTVVDALRNAPDVTRGILNLFMVTHDPSFSGDRDKARASADDAIRSGLVAVKAINDDRLLRLYRSLVEAVVRTNAFAPAAAEALAFKLDSAQVPGLPRPLPWREIFVYSRRVEGVHLRAGPVARGGLRWSDRRDDFRTEVLGLMKAQRVKNAVIVPTGAKGGFYPKALPAVIADQPETRDAWAAEGKGAYQVFIRTLLSVTDNIVKDKVVHPADVVVTDGDDPYFVVAADKGTASFSDVANAIAEQAGFWLDDAFASGGSKGYDHKAMGITARGAWVSVTRHFLEMGVDVQTDPVRVIGCGDMSGDVFGNGMLLSQTIMLQAAFDHRHVFLDPAPDAAKAWKERQRLFGLTRSSWADYDSGLISKGGGVFSRAEKSIPLSDEVREMLGIDAAEIDPDGLIRAILLSNADLLWFGGIGTYIKASTETNAAVGDPANDALRVDARDVRVKVIGEGANLGITQAARIEYALLGNGDEAPGGGRINTDFIDNSAGVDCSDNEVNIKIALASAKRAGRLSEEARVKLLVEMTDEVAAHVLEDNRLQALALSIAQSHGAQSAPSYARLIESLEEGGNLDRRTEGLAEAEALSRRASEGQGLTRPELAVVLSSSKLVLQDAIENSALPDDPGLEDELLAAFPAPMRKKYRKDILSHRLRREIIATRIANRVVNRLGMIHPFELVEEEGVALAHVATAFVAAERLFGMDAIWTEIETGAMGEAARLELFDRAAAALRTQMADLLRTSDVRSVASKLVAELAPAVRKLSARTARLLSPEGLIHSDRMLDSLTAAGAPKDIARKVARLFDLDGAVGLARLAHDRKADPEVLTRAFGMLGTQLGLDWAQMTATRMTPSDPWERLLVAGLARDFQQMRLDFLRRSRSDNPSDWVERWSADHDTQVRQLRTVIARAQAATPVAPAMLAQIASQARSLLSR